MRSASLSRQRTEQRRAFRVGRSQTVNMHMGMPLGTPCVETTKYGDEKLLFESQGAFIHVNPAFSGSITRDISGRQRIIRMDQVVHLLCSVQNEHFAASVRSKIASTKLDAKEAFDEDNFTTAVALYRKALAMFEDIPALDSYGLRRADILHGLGQAYRELHRHAEAEACYIETLRLQKLCFGREYAENFTLLHELGALFKADGYVQGTAALYQRSFAGYLRTLGEDSPETLNSMLDMIDVYIPLNDLRKALLLLEKAGTSLVRILGINNKTTLIAMNKLSMVYRRSGLREESHQLSGKIIPQCHTIFGMMDPTTQSVVGRYIKCADNLDFPIEISSLLAQYKRCLEPRSLRIIYHLGKAYMRMGLMHDAVELLEDLSYDLPYVHGRGSIECIKTIDALCTCLESLGDVQKTVDSYTRLIQLIPGHARESYLYLENKMVEFLDWQDAVEVEGYDWGIYRPGACFNCDSFTSNWCSGMFSPFVSFLVSLSKHLLKLNVCFNDRLQNGPILQ